MRILLIGGIVAAMTTAVYAQDPRGLDDGTSLGDLTRESIADGFDQGKHASDPSGDGVGRENRVGLANVVSRGDLGETVGLLKDLTGE
ncbi:hypothetical protein [Sedimentimonas flavescens]|uniref:hypothetical protein n=1 Tax=Sedimentimonas flavescens TaxID=2851012 RepID=UPI0021A7300F|nr:hypothetical protein [Sedimentimonas flavescens]MCT2538977.1 hypothetical protein [Sedimentimonas flavescens]WBL32230.1 hypothetical protein O5O51_10815 [Sinirhodobacter sp. HNIBRBA609]